MGLFEKSRLRQKTEKLIFLITRHYPAGFEQTPTEEKALNKSPVAQAIRVLKKDNF